MMHKVALFLALGSGSALRVPATPQSQTRRAALEAAGRTLALGSLAALPSLASADCTPFDGTGCGVPTSTTSGQSTAGAYARSVGRRAATVNVSGKYADPQHPGMPRKVSKSGDFLFVNGADEDGKKFSLKGSIEGRALTIDFSPKGGPSALSATVDFSPKDGSQGITFPDGNRWVKI